MGLHSDGHPSESMAYMVPTRRLQGKKSLYKSYPDGYPSGRPLKDKDLPTMTAQSQPIRVFTLTATRVVNSLYGSNFDGYKGKITYMGPTMMTIPRSSPKNKDPRRHTGASRVVIQHPKKI